MYRRQPRPPCGGWPPTMRHKHNESHNWSPRARAAPPFQVLRALSTTTSGCERPAAANGQSACGMLISSMRQPARQRHTQAAAPST